MNIVSNNYQQDSGVLHTFAPMTNISLTSFVFLKTINSEFSYIEVWIMDQSFKPIEIEDKTNFTLFIN